MALENFKLKILSRAKLEADEAALYYESKSKGVGKYSIWNLKTIVKH
jgi:hypothetical protein